MTVTLQIKDKKLDEFWAFIQTYNLLEDQAEENEAIPQWQIDETRRRDLLMNEPAPRLWSEIKEEYVRKGI